MHTSSINIYISTLDGRNRRVPQLLFFSGRARHFSQTGSNRPLLTQAENGDRRVASAPLRETGWEPRRVVHGSLYSQDWQYRSVAAMDARSVRARMAPSSRDGGAGLPFRPTRSQRPRTPKGSPEGPVGTAKERRMKEAASGRAGPQIFLRHEPTPQTSLCNCLCRFFRSEVRSNSNQIG